MDGFESINFQDGCVAEKLRKEGQRPHYSTSPAPSTQEPILEPYENTQKYFLLCLKLNFGRDKIRRRRGKKHPISLGRKLTFHHETVLKQTC